MPHSPLPVVSPRKFLTYYVCTSVAAMLAVALFNAVVDPLWVYHAPWLKQAFVKDARQANPGQARFSNYDSVIIGNSQTENLDISTMQTQLGWRPLKLSISGSTSREQHLILDQALATGQVRDVLWSIDLGVFSRGPEATRTSDFPFHLYKRNLETPFKYLLSGSTLAQSCRVLMGEGPRDQESRFTRDRHMTYGPASVARDLQATVNNMDSLAADEQIVWESAQSQFLEVIRSHPEVRFHIVVPPASALFRAIKLHDNGEMLATWLRFKGRLAHALVGLDNVKLFDFEMATSVTHDLRRYADLIHYDLDTSNELIGWIAAGKYRVCRESIDDNLLEQERETREYAAALFTRESPFYEQLQIDSVIAKLPDLANVGTAAVARPSSPIRTVATDTTRYR